MSNHPSDSAIMLQLTAYLDGELDNDEIQQVEERLATDDQYRGVLQQLQKTWDVLDILPASSANPSFTQSTMKLVIEDAKHLTQQKQNRVGIWSLRILALILVPAAASAGAYVASHYLQSQPYQQLEQNLPQIRDYDVYNKDKNVSVEFLELLAKETSLIGVSENKEMETEERFVNFSNPPNTLADLSAMSNDAKSQLRINRANYQRAEASDKQRVANLIREIDNHAHRADLKQALYQYYYWLRKIPESDEAELMDLKDSRQRIAKIKSIVEQRVYNNFELQLPQEDFDQIKLMLFRTATVREKLIERTFLDKLGFEELEDTIYQAERQKNLSTQLRPVYKTGLLLKQLNATYPEYIEEIVTPDDVQQTKLILSEDAQMELQWAAEWKLLTSPIPTDLNQIESELITNWMLAVFDAMFNPVTPTNLIEVFDSLPKSKQDELNNEHPADRERILKTIYRENYQSTP